MRRSLVFKIGLLMVASILVLSVVLFIQSMQSLSELNVSLTDVTEALLEEDLVHKSRRDQQTLLTYGSSLAEYLARIASSPLWNFEEGLLTEYADNLLELPNVSSVQIMDDRGSVVAGSLYEGGNIQTFTRTILHGTREIGTIELGIDLSMIDELARENDAVKESLLEAFESQSQRTQRNQTMQMLLISSIICASILAISIYLVFRLTAPLRRMNKMVKDLGSGAGDLTVKMNVSSKDEIGALATAFNSFLETLRRMILEMTETSGEIKTTTEGFENIITTQSESSKVTFEMMENIEHNSVSISNALEEVSAELEHISSQSIIISNNAQQISSSTNSTEKDIETIHHAAQKIVSVMQNANAEMIETIESVETLTSNAKNISTILDTITSIAEQTNLLALNAAIEAARAGEAGRGFAVVADEIRKLAEESKGSADKISKILHQISDQSYKVREKTGATTKIVEEASQHSQSIQKDLDKILQDARSIRDKVKEASEETRSQSESTEQIALAINHATQNTLDMNTEIEVSLNAMKSLLDEIQKIRSSAEVLQQAFGNLSEQMDRFVV